MIKTQNEFVPDEAEIKVFKMFERKIDGKISYSAIIETTAKVYEDIIIGEKLSIGVNRCNVFENIYISRYNKCLGFNHMASVCTKKLACLKCNGEHQVKDCTEVTKFIICSLAAAKFNLQLDTNHQGNSVNCKIYHR